MGDVAEKTDDSSSLLFPAESEQLVCTGPLLKPRKDPWTVAPPRGKHPVAFDEAEAEAVLPLLLGDEAAGLFE